MPTFTITDRDIAAERGKATWGDLCQAYPTLRSCQQSSRILYNVAGDREETTLGEVLAIDDVAEVEAFACEKDPGLVIDPSTTDVQMAYALTALAGKVRARRGRIVGGTIAVLSALGVGIYLARD